MAVTGAPSVERELALTHAGYVAFAFVLPLLAAAILEAGVALLSDTIDRGRLVVAAQAVLAASLLMLAWTTSAWGLALGLAVAGAASGVACGAAQALLVLSDPRGPDRAMVRWTLHAAVGDVLTPLVTAAAVAHGRSYRGAMLAVAAVVALQCLASYRAGRRATGAASSADPSATDEPPAEPLRAALRRAARSPRVWAWLLAAAICTLLDELVVALNTLRMARDQGAGDAWAAAGAAGFALGGVIGSALVDRAVARLGPRAVLVASCVLCAASLAGLLEPRTAVASSVALLVLGVTCAPHHALSMARAYDEMPANPGTVQALGQLFVVVDLAAPLALGLIADRWGLRAALACLLLQPALVGVLAVLLAPDRRATGAPPRA